MGGIERKFSVLEFAWRCGLLARKDGENPIAEEYAIKCLKVVPDFFNCEGAWKKIGRGKFMVSGVDESSILDPFHHLLHRFLKYTVVHDQFGRRLSEKSLFLLSGMLSPGMPISVPHVFANFLCH